MSNYGRVLRLAFRAVWLVAVVSGCSQTDESHFSRLEGSWYTKLITFTGIEDGEQQAQSQEYDQGHLLTVIRPDGSFAYEPSILAMAEGINDLKHLGDRTYPGTDSSENPDDQWPYVDVVRSRYTPALSEIAYRIVYPKENRTEGYIKKAELRSDGRLDYSMRGVGTELIVMKAIAYRGKDQEPMPKPNP